MAGRDACAARPELQPRCGPVPAGEWRQRFRQEQPACARWPGSSHWSPAPSRGAGRMRARITTLYHGELAWLSHGPGLKGDLSAQENLRFSAGLRRPLERSQIDAALAKVGYGAADGRLARHMSAGQQRRVALARVLLLDCALWLLDEPTSNLDGRGQDMFGQILSAHLAGGGLAVISTHQPLPVPADRVQALELS